ncbi:MAG TPA: YdcF family protein, partial [Acidisoma sp.]|nr:YdcF family protein [Acidisoma sp.]
LPPSVTGIIVLGGAVETELSAARGLPSLNAAAERMTSFVTLARHYPQARLAFTGGNGNLIHTEMMEADVARELFDDLGLADRHVIYESRSRTTYENVEDLKALAKPQSGEIWLLITSAWHMPRSVGIFRRAGWPVVPYPVGYKTAPGALMAFRGTFPERLELADLAVHEWIGLTAYWLMGRTSALFPAPQG